jgi:hypothetical protein
MCRSSMPRTPVNRCLNERQLSRTCVPCGSGCGFSANSMRCRAAWPCSSPSSRSPSHPNPASGPLTHTPLRTYAAPCKPASTPFCCTRYTPCKCSSIPLCHAAAVAGFPPVQSAAVPPGPAAAPPACHERPAEQHWPAWPEPLHHQPAGNTGCCSFIVSCQA